MGKFEMKHPSNTYPRVGRRRENDILYNLFFHTRRLVVFQKMLFYPAITITRLCLCFVRVHLKLKVQNISYLNSILYYTVLIMALVDRGCS